MERKAIYAAVPAALSALVAWIAVSPLWLTPAVEHWDHLGHRHAIKFLAENCFPSSSCWNPDALFGYSQGLFYPPLFHWLGAGLSLLSDELFAYRLLLSAALIATPFAIYICLRLSDLKSAAAAFGTLGIVTLQLAWTPLLGANLISSVWVGNAAQAFSLPFFFLYIGCAARLFRGRSPSGAALLLAVVLVSHLVSGIAAVVVAVSSAMAQGAGRKVLRALLVHLLAGVSLAGFWVIPFLTLSRPKIPSIGIINFGFLESLLLALVAIHLLGVGGLRITKMRHAAISAIGILIALLLNTILDHPLGLHYDRFSIYILFAAILSLSELAETLTRRLKLNGLIICIIWLLSLGVYSKLHPLPYHTNPMPPLPRFAAPAGNVLSLTAADNIYGNHQDLYMLPLAGRGRMSKGLFLESSFGSPYALTLEALFQSCVQRSALMLWGGYTPQRVFRSRLHPRMRQRFLSHFNISHILVNSELDGGCIRTRRVARLPRGRSLQQAGDTSIVEILDELPVAVPASSYSAAARRRIRRGVFRPVLYDRDLSAAPMNGTWSGRLSAVTSAPTLSSISFKVEADRPVPILLKMNWAPQWKALDEEGREMPIYRALPTFMLLFGRGEIRLSYQPHWSELVGRIVSLLAIGWITLARMRHYRADSTGPVDITLNISS